MVSSPIDYTLKESAQNPTSSFMQGFKESVSIGSLENAKARNDAMKKDIISTLSKQDVSGKDYVELSTKYPEMGNDINSMFKIMSSEQKKVKIQDTIDLVSTLKKGENNLAKDMLERKAIAYENSGKTAIAEELRSKAKIIDINPMIILDSAAMDLAVMLGPDFEGTYGKLEDTRVKSKTEDSTVKKAEAEADEAVAKAQKASVASGFEESNQIADLKKKGWDVEKIKSDIETSKANVKIAALKARQEKTKNENEAKKLDLEIQKAEAARDEKIREKVSAVKSSRVLIDNSISTIDSLLDNPELDNVVGSIEGLEFYPNNLIAMLVPGADADIRADAISGVETVQSQQFISNLLSAKEQGATFGALDKNEGLKLEGYIASLKRKQSEPKFRETMKNIRNILMKTRTIMSEKNGMPDTIPDTTNVKTPAEDLNKTYDSLEDEFKALELELEPLPEFEGR